MDRRPESEPRPTVYLPTWNPVGQINNCSFPISRTGYFVIGDENFYTTGFLWHSIFSAEAGLTVLLVASQVLHTLEKTTLTDVKYSGRLKKKKKKKG